MVKDVKLPSWAARAPREMLEIVEKWGFHESVCQPPDDSRAMQCGACAGTRGRRTQRTYVAQTAITTSRWSEAANTGHAAWAAPGEIEIEARRATLINLDC